LQKDEIEKNLLHIGNVKINENNKEYDFIARKDDGRQARFIPIIKGRIFENNNIYIIDLKVSSPLYMRIFMLIVLGIFIIGLLLSLVMKLPEEDIIYILFLFLGLLIITIISQLQFLYEYKKTKKHFIDLFKAEEIKYKQ
jgi:hypothetical protein